jgi:chromosome segregation ATPase
VILHRLRLTNFRGVTDREIAFPDHGVVVVCGPNEVGKSSMLEALDLLLTYRDRSAHRDVKQVKPTHADVGAQVEAEISTGPYRFVYRKRFHKQNMTELEVIEPRREQLTGDEAHERVVAILDETVDTKLWDAQRVLQSASTNAVNLSGCDALSRALDVAAGEAATSAGTDSLLIDRIEAEFLRYFTATGRPTKEWKSAIDRLAVAQLEADRCRAAVGDVDERVRRHEELTSASQNLAAALNPATQRSAAARQAQVVVTELSEQLGKARQCAATTAASGANSALANGQRQQLIADSERRTVTLAALCVEFATAQTEEVAARQVADAATAAAAQYATELEAARQRLDVARATAQACLGHAEADRLAARLQRIGDAERNLAELARQLAAIALTDEMLAVIEQSSALVERLQAQLDAEAPTIEFTAGAKLGITVDGDARTLRAGTPWSTPASAAVVVDVPGVVSVRIDPGVTAVKLRTELHAAQKTMADTLEEAGASTPVEVRELDRQRRTLAAAHGQQAAALAGLCDGEGVEELRSRLAEIRSTTPDPGVDAEAAAAELSAADQALGVVRVAAEAQDRAAAAATQVLTGKTTQATLLRDRMTTAEIEFTAVCEQLTMLRAAVDDETVAASAAADETARREAEQAAAVLAERFGAADPDGVAAELAAATAAAGEISREHDAVTLELHNISVELAVIGSEGRQGRLDEAEAELERAREHHERIQLRAEAAQLLRDTMIRHRDNTRQRYVAPYRTELERLGRTVFGPSFEVEVDAELTICSRTLDGRTVPYDSLSGGAKEQLGILARLAGAALVAKEDTVPVVIDDALGFSDPERLVKMGAVFSTVGDRGQVIVLTCSPGRYDGIADAEVIDLSA